MNMKSALWMVCLAMVLKETTLEKEKKTSGDSFQSVAKRVRRESLSVNQNSESNVLNERSQRNYEDPRQSRDARSQGDKDLTPRQDCYENNGSEYRGGISRTIQGSTCVSWNHPSATINPQTHPEMGLGDHNYCRNPDGDTKPWCWTKPHWSIYGYCAISKCSKVHILTNSLKADINNSGFGLGRCRPDQFYCPSMNPYNLQCIHKKDVCDTILNCIGREDENANFCKSYLCKEGEFFCEIDKFCISQTHVCDGKSNCADSADEKNCSNLISNRNPDFVNKGRVVGGFRAQYGQIPWQVGIRLLEKSNDHWCGGSILNEDWVISAAHCFGVPKNNFRVRTGDWDNNAADKFEQVFEIEELHLHPQWNSVLYDYDLALIKIKRNDGVGIKLNNHVAKVPLPSFGMVPDQESKCLISGWGDTLYSYPEMLHAAKVPLLKKEKCSEFYKGRITERMLCAGFEKGEIDTCQGDSGGPLVCKVNGVYTIFGVTSWGNGCGLARKTGVYANVQIMLDWVKKLTGL